MSPVVPAPFLFRYSIPVRRIDALPQKSSPLLDLPADCTIPALSELTGEPRWAEVRIAWNPRGLGISVDVKAKPGAWRFNADFPEDSDGLHVWIDTRNTQSIHRASRFCHQFCLLGAGSGKRGDEPTVRQVVIPRAREEAPPADVTKIRIERRDEPARYSLAAWLPAETLHGYDPEANPRLGFFYRFRAGGAEQYLTVGQEFPITYDPSLWSTLELIG